MYQVQSYENGNWFSVRRGFKSLDKAIKAAELEAKCYPRYKFRVVCMTPNVVWNSGDPIIPFG